MVFVYLTTSFSFLKIKNREHWHFKSDLSRIVKLMFLDSYLFAWTLCRIHLNLWIWSIYKIDIIVDIIFLFLYFTSRSHCGNIPLGFFWNVCSQMCPFVQLMVTYSARRLQLLSRPEVSLESEGDAFWLKPLGQWGAIRPVTLYLVADASMHFFIQCKI